MASLRYITHGTCSRAINVEVEDGIVKSVEFEGGCNGNTKGVASLVEGMEVEEHEHDEVAEHEEHEIGRAHV